MPPHAIGDAARRIAELSRDDPLVTGSTAIEAMLDDALEGNPPRRSE